MKKYSRRRFIERSTAAVPSLLLMSKETGWSGNGTDILAPRNKPEAIIPMPLQVVIDDVGWWSGEDGSMRQEPYRTGISRNHVPADYQAIADLGRSLGIRPQAAMILCEWDKKNILRNLPTATWMGDKWDNSKWVGPWMDEAADIIRNNSKYFEITIHGVGHEYWEGGKFTRAEWTDSDGRMRPAGQVKKHLDYYAMLLEQHDLGPLPVSFVPAAFRHCFGRSEGRDISLAEIFGKYGVNYINTPFSIMFNKESAENELFGIDSGVLTIDRGEDQFDWEVFPGDPQTDLKGPTCGIHWPNMLHPDPAQNNQVVEAWVKYLKHLNEKPDMMLASDSTEMQHQLVHRQLTKIAVRKDQIDLDFADTDKLPRDIGKKSLAVKVQSDRELKFTSDTLVISSAAVKKNDGFLYTVIAGRIPGKRSASIKFDHT